MVTDSDIRPGVMMRYVEDGQRSHFFTDFWFMIISVDDESVDILWNDMAMSKSQEYMDLKMNLLK